VFALGSASARVDGGLHALAALRQILQAGCGALVLPEQINVGRAEEAFDDMDNLKDDALTTVLKEMVQRLIDLASVMPKATE
jgi:NAD(P)H-dependent FMN reductase